MGIFSNLLKPAIPAYENNKQYHTYSVTKIQKKWDPRLANNNAKTIMAQIKDCVHLCQTTTNPLVFFIDMIC